MSKKIKISSKIIEIIKQEAKEAISEQTQGTTSGETGGEEYYASYEERGKERDKTYLSDNFSIEKVKTKNPDLAKAINLFTTLNTKNSNLLFDGQKLHWRVGERIIYSWAASSGHFEDSVIGKWGKTEAIKQFQFFVKILADTNKSAPQRENLITTWLVKWGADVDENDISDVVSSWDRMAGLKQQYEAMGDDLEGDAQGPPMLSPTKKEERRIIRDYNKLGRIVKKKLEKYLAQIHSDHYKTSPEQRRSQTKFGSYMDRNKKKYPDYEFNGPIPEGEYVIQHRLQDISNTSQFGLEDAINYGVLAMVQNMEANGFPQWKIDEYMDSIDDASSKISIGDPRVGDSWASDWGNFRVRITNKNRKAKQMIQKGEGYDLRNSFYIHGGSWRGSGGCIDLGDEVESFAEFWTLGGVTKIMGPTIKNPTRAKEPLWLNPNKMNSLMKIPLTVSYTTPVKKKLLSKNKVAKQNANLVFSGN